MGQARRPTTPRTRAEELLGLGRQRLRAAPGEPHHRPGQCLHRTRNGSLSTAPAQPDGLDPRVRSDNSSSSSLSSSTRTPSSATAIASAGSQGVSVGVLTNGDNAGWARRRGSSRPCSARAARGRGGEGRRRSGALSRRSPRGSAGSLRGRATPEQCEGGGGRLALEADRGQAGRAEHVGRRRENGRVLADPHHGIGDGRRSAGELAKGEPTGFAVFGQAVQGRGAAQVQGQDGRGQLVPQQPHRGPGLTSPFGALTIVETGQRTGPGQSEGGQRCAVIKGVSPAKDPGSEGG